MTQQILWVRLLVLGTFMGFCAWPLYPASVPIFYNLVAGSRLVDECPICDRLPIIVPLRGTFELRLISEDPLFSTYAIENFTLTSNSSNGFHYALQGKGVYRVGGEVALQQSLFLEAQVDNGYTNFLCYLTNSFANVTRLWPMLLVGADQTNGTAVQQFHLDIHAAPFRELWFSTAKRFKVPTWSASSNEVSDGDLISSTGRLVRRNSDLTARLGVQPIVPDLGARNIQAIPGGELAFSVVDEEFSETLGPLRTGDLFSDSGHILRTIEEVLATFQPQPSDLDDVRLDSVQFMDDGQLYFSVQTNLFSTRLHRSIGRGDLLSDLGKIIKSNSQLLARLGPTNAAVDYGLKSACVWPSGETWFSTETGFYGANSSYYAPGDLLSDQGYVIYRNTDLLYPIIGNTSGTDLGLDGLFIISDVFTIEPKLSNTRVNLRLINQPTQSMLFQWSRGARVFQLERASSLSGPFLPVSAIDTGGAAIDDGMRTNLVPAFYRVHQW